MAEAGTGVTASGGGTLLSPPGSFNRLLGGAFDEREWVIQISNTLKDLGEEDKGMRVSVFKVPNSLLQTKPEAYAPQLIALGPYHQWRPELYEMEQYKLSSAKSIQKTLPSGQIQDMVDEFRKHNHEVRAHYHRYLDIAVDTLAWMMVVDACFLLEFLEVYAVDEDGNAFCQVTSLMRRLVDVAGRCRSAQNTILRDVMMMENQIPLFLVKKIKNMQVIRRDCSLDGDELFVNAVTAFMKEVSPFKMLSNENVPSIDIIFNRAHLLDVLYYFLVGEIGVDDCETDAYENDVHSTRNDGEEKKEDSDSSNVKQLFESLWEDGGQGGNESSATNQQPKIEELVVPSVEDLVRSGVHFSPTEGDLRSISFDYVTATFYLPAITLDVHADVVTIWNGMSNSIRLSKVPLMDKVIEEVNHYYSSRWRVKTRKYVKKYVFDSWQVLTFLAAILLLLLTGLQSFCSVYSCGKWFKVPVVQPQG